MIVKRNNPLFTIAFALCQVEGDNMPCGDNPSPELQAAEEAADKRAYAIGDEAVDFWENEAHDVKVQAEFDGFEKGFLVGAAMALVSPTRTMQTTAEYYECRPGLPVILPLIATAMGGGTADA